ncbi:hypothetical protein ACVW07_000485 [Cellulomonas sp. URHB0016]
MAGQVADWTGPCPEFTRRDAMTGPQTPCHHPFGRSARCEPARGGTGSEYARRLGNILFDVTPGWHPTSCFAR